MGWNRWGCPGLCTPLSYPTFSEKCTNFNIIHNSPFSRMWTLPFWIPGSSPEIWAVNRSKYRDPDCLTYTFLRSNESNQSGHQTQVTWLECKTTDNYAAQFGYRANDTQVKKKWDKMGGGIQGLHSPVIPEIFWKMYQFWYYSQFSVLTNVDCSSKNSWILPWNLSSKYSCEQNYWTPWIFPIGFYSKQVMQYWVLW